MAKGKINVGRSGLWRPTVYPYLDKLGTRLNGRSENSVSLDVEGVRIVITPLEQDLVLAMAKDEEPFARRHVLVRDGLGLRIKILSELNSLAQQSSKTRADTLDTIRDDIALGWELMHEITLEMRSISDNKQIDEAREFSQYRQQLSRVIGEAEKRIAQRSGVTEETDIWDTRPSRPKARPKPGHAEQPETVTTSRSSTAAWIVLGVITVAAGATAIWFLFLN